MQDFLKLLLALSNIKHTLFLWTHISSLTHYLNVPLPPSVSRLKKKKGSATFESISLFAKEMDSKTIELTHKKGLIKTSNEGKQA